MMYESIIKSIDDMLDNASKKDQLLLLEELKAHIDIKIEAIEEQLQDDF